jgi:NADPH:quinone reductase-like Zn-dependent oxidoreductase
VCIVRREEQAEICRQAGANDDLIFNSADDDFHAKLSAKCAEVSCTLGFDAVSGELSGTMLNAMPNGATLRLYGGLSEQPPSRISTKDLIFRQKTLTGFWLSEYVKSKSLWQLWNWSSIVTSRILDDFSQEVVKAVPLENVTDALADYVANMSAGKVLVDCSEQDS